MTRIRSSCPIPSRRDFLKLAAMMPAFGTVFAAPHAALAQLGGPIGSGNAGYFRFSLGSYRLTVLSDGYFSLPTSGLGMNASEEDVQAFLRRHFLDPQAGYSHTNHLVVETGTATVLVDVGSGNRFLDTAGRLITNMEAAGLDPSSVTHVVITHAHPDHIWGIRDDFDEALFPAAEYIIGANEHAYWMQDDLVNRVPAMDQQFVLGAVNSINCDGIEWTLAQSGYEVVPGVRMLDTPGHTAGHMSVVLESEGQQLMALGDALSHAWLSFRRPLWYNAFDADGAQTVATRLKILDMCSADRIAVLGYHFPFPGVGHVSREGEEFSFVPAMWQF